MLLETPLISGEVGCLHYNIYYVNTVSVFFPSDAVDGYRNFCILKCNKMVKFKDNLETQCFFRPWHQRYVLSSFPTLRFIAAYNNSHKYSF